MPSSSSLAAGSQLCLQGSPVETESVNPGGITKRALCNPLQPCPALSLALPPPQNPCCGKSLAELQSWAWEKSRAQPRPQRVLTQLHKHGPQELRLQTLPCPKWYRHAGTAPTHLFFPLHPYMCSAPFLSHPGPPSLMTSPQGWTGFQFPKLQAGNHHVGHYKNNDLLRRFHSKS